MTNAPFFVLFGNPNTGKSTLYNRLARASVRVGNYPGITVSIQRSSITLPGSTAAVLADLPGAYSLSASSPEEELALKAVLGLEGAPQPDAVVIVADAQRIQRSLYLILQVLSLNIPVIVALNMMDEARSNDQIPNISAIQSELGVPVVGLSARTGEGVDSLLTAMAQSLRSDQQQQSAISLFGPSINAVLDKLEPELPDSFVKRIDGDVIRRRGLSAWLLLSVSDEDDASANRLDRFIRFIRSDLAKEGRDIDTEIIGSYYAWIDARESIFFSSTASSAAPMSERIDRVLMHPLWGSLVFLSIMSALFYALFEWSAPFVALIDYAFGLLGDSCHFLCGHLAVASPQLAPMILFFDRLFVEGLLAGVGAVLVFIPQIGLLFAFLAFLEDCGYLARAAQLMDRILRLAGLPGQAFVPLLSGFACAVPAIMATKTLPRFRDRLLTMMVIPFTSCSARLPVYSLIIASMFPSEVEGFPLDVRPVALFAIYLFSIVFCLITAVVLGKTILKESPTPTILEVPPYRMPQLKTLSITVYGKVQSFVKEAGSVIVSATLVLWVLLSFPVYSAEELFSPSEIEAILVSDQSLDQRVRFESVQHSYAAQMGKAIEPAIRPLGFDWRIGVGIIGSFAAREVFVSTMAVVYGVESANDGSDTLSLSDHLRQQKKTNGAPLYTPLVGFSLMIFFSLALQCTSTIAILRKETGGWRWPTFIFAYMSGLAWIGSFIVFQVGRLAGFAG